MQAASEPLLVVKSGRAGFIDVSGSLLVAPRYARCGRWSEGRLWVQEHAGSDSPGTFLDEQAKPVSPMCYRDLSAVRPELPLPSFNKGVVVVGMPKGGFGYLDVSGKVLAMTSRPGAFQRQDGELLLCVVSNRTGFIDRIGNVVVPPQYEAATPFSGGRAGVRQATQWGLIDGTGGWVAKPAFERLRPASDDARIWAYREGGRSGLIDRAGRRLTDAIYLDTGPSSGSAIAVQGSTGWGLVAENGSELIKSQYANLWPFGTDASLWMAQSPAGKWGVVATNDHERVACRFDFVMAATPEVWLAQQSGLWGILDPATGRWRLPPVFNRILPLETPFKNKVLVEQSGRWGVVDGETGKELLETRYRRIGQWGAFVAVEKGRDMKLMDAALNEVLSWQGAFDGLPEYETLTGDSGVLVTVRGATRITRDGKMPWSDYFEDAGEWSDRLLAVKRNGRWGFVDETGKWVLDPGFELLVSVAEGVAPVCETGRWGLIRLDGNKHKRLFTTDAEAMGRPWQGLVPVRREGRWGLIDFDGKAVLPCEYETLEWGLDEAGASRFYGIDPERIPGLTAYGR